MSLLVVLLLAPLLSGEERTRFEDAIQLHLRADLEGASSEYGSLLEDHPDFVPARLYRAEALWLLDRREEAKAELELLPATARDVLLYRVLRRTFGFEAPYDAVAEKIRKAYPLEVHRFLATGTPVLVLLSTGDLVAAAEDYRRVLPLDPSDATLHRQLGTAFAKARQWLPAVEAFEHVVAEHPDDVVAWRQIGTGNLVLQRWAPSIEAFERALRIRPDEPNVLLALGYAYERSPDYDSALALYRRAAKLAPDSSAPRYRMGRALIALSKLDEAETELDKAHEIDPSAPEPLSYLGELYLKRGDTDRAVASLLEAIECDGNFFEAYYHLAQAYQRMGRREEAKRAIARYEELKREQRHVPSQEEVLAASPNADQVKRRIRR